MSPVIGKVKEVLGEYIYGIDVPSLEAAVLEKLLERGLTFSSAESCTGGLIAKRITDIPGASQVFKGAVVAYTNEVKHKVLGVSLETLDKYGAVSSQTALEMAEGVRRLTGSHIAVSTTGICGPSTDERNTPVGTAFIGLSAEGKAYFRQINMGSDRDRGRTIAAHHAFDMILKYLK